jgi:hypothetical protein
MEGKDVNSVLEGNLSERGHWGDPDVDGRIILRWMEGWDLHRVLMDKPEGKRPLGRSLRGLENNIKMDVGHRCSQVSVGET